MDNYTPHSGSPLERLKEEVVRLHNSGKIPTLSPDLVERFTKILKALVMDGVHEASDFPINTTLQDINEEVLRIEESEYTDRIDQKEIDYVGVSL